MDLEVQPIIAATRTEDDFAAACRSACEVIFMLTGSISTLPACIAQAHEAGKEVFLHMDLADGIGKDAEGVQYVAALGADGIISTRVHMIRAAKECGIRCVQRFFMVDSHSVDTALESIRTAHPDMIEIMPGIAFKTIRRLKKQVNMPIIAGGLLEEKEEIIAALGAGASAVSTGKKELWEL